jgi:hypothetical protein
MAPGGTGKGIREKAIEKIRSLEKELRRRRHVRTKAVDAESRPSQTLTCVEPDNALMVTAAGLALWPDGRPDCLGRAGGDLVLPDGSPGRLRRGRYRKPWVAGRAWTSPERVEMSLLFRLQRYGVAAPEVLAVGERPGADGTIDAFLLTRLPGRVVGALARRRGLSGRLMEEADALLDRVHRAGCYFRGGMDELAVVESGEGPAHVALTGASGLVLRRRLRRWWRWRDLRRLARLTAGASPCITEGCP